MVVPAMTGEVLEEQSQRIRVELARTEQLVKICVEHYDESLGWYNSASLSLPLHQLPLLQQAVEEMRASTCPPPAGTDKIVPFPTAQG